MNNRSTIRKAVLEATIWLWSNCSKKSQLQTGQGSLRENFGVNGIKAKWGINQALNHFPYLLKGDWKWIF